MNEVLPSIYDCRDAVLVLNATKAKKHFKISHPQYELIERCYIDYFFQCNPDIDRKKWTTWSIANNLKQSLKEQLKGKGFIILPPPAPMNLHPYQTSKKGLDRILAIEHKIRLQKKLKRKNPKE